MNNFQVKPIRIIADTTRACNLHCWYCHSSSGPDYKGPVLSGEDIAEILQVAENLKIFEVTITGGEPAMWKGLVDLVKASHNCKFTTIQLITNATLVTPNFLNLLKDSNIKRICVSLDGSQNYHDSIRGNGMFLKTIDGLRKLIDVVNNITVISVLTKENFSSWFETTKLLIEIGVKQHHLAPVCFAGYAMEDYDANALSLEQFNEVHNFVNMMSEKLPKDFSLRFNDILVNNFSFRSMSLQSFTENFKGWHVVIRPDRKVNFSVKAWGRTWRSNETVGTIDENSLKEILENKQSLGVLEEYNSFERSEEIARKFHLGNNISRIVHQDKFDVQTPSQVKVRKLEETSKISTSILDDLTFISQMPLENNAKLKQSIIRNPSQYRLKIYPKFGLLFDTLSFDIHILTTSELNNWIGISEVPK